MAAFAYGLWERSNAGADIGIPDVVASVVSSRPYISFVVLPIVLMMIAKSAQMELRAEVRMRRGSHRGTANALARAAGRHSVTVVSASVLGSWASAIGLGPLVFTGGGTAAIDERIPWFLTVASQSTGLALFSFATSLVLGFLTMSCGVSRPLAAIVGGGLLWVVAAGSLNSLWGEVLSLPLACAGVAVNCGTWAAGLAWSLSAAAVALAATVSVATWTDRRHSYRLRVSNGRVWVGSLIVAVITMWTTLAIADETGSDVTVETILFLAFSADPTSPRTFLLALGSFVVLLMAFSVRFDGASVGFADLERLRAGGVSAHAARILLTATGIGVVVRTSMLVAGWLPVAISGRAVETQPLPFLAGAVIFVLVGALWWGILGLAVGLAITHCRRIGMIVPIACGVAATLHVLRLSIGGVSSPSPDALVNPFAMTFGTAIEASIIVVAAASLVTAGYIDRWKARRVYPVAIDNTEEPS